MKKLLVLVMVLYSATAIAQDKPPPTVGGKPLVQVAPKGPPPKEKPQSVAQKLQACLEIDDATKERLDCYDAVFPPKANPKAKGKPANAVTDCRAVKEEDERLACFNRFAEKLPKPPK